MEGVDNPVTVNSTPVVGDEGAITDDDSLTISDHYRITDEEDENPATSADPLVGDEYGAVVATGDTPPTIAVVDASGASTADVCPDYVALTEAVMKMPSLTDLQRQCLASIVASYCSPDEFGKRLLMSLAFSVFGFHEEEEVQVFLPLVGVGIDPAPFAVDMKMDDYVDRSVLL